jgi:hypothetical protein
MGRQVPLCSKTTVDPNATLGLTAPRRYNWWMPSSVSLTKLKRNRAYVLVLAFVLSGLIETLVHWHASPDARWMSITALSIYLLFEVGLFFAPFVVKR